MRIELHIDKNDLVKMYINKPFHEIRLEDLQAKAFKKAVHCDKVIFKDVTGSTKVLKDISTIIHRSL